MSPSTHHEALSLRPFAWARSRATAYGIRPGREIRLTSRYVADAVLIASLQCRHSIRYGPHTNGIPDLFVFETKTSRSDYRETFIGNGRRTNRLTPIGSLHFIVAPPGLIDPYEVPDFWGLLVESGRGLQEIKPPTRTPLPLSHLQRATYELLRHPWNEGHDYHHRPPTPGIRYRHPKKDI